jgi:hypothetical protein
MFNELMEYFWSLTVYVGGVYWGLATVVAYQYRKSGRFRHILAMATSHALLVIAMAFAVEKIHPLGILAWLVSIVAAAYGFYVLQRGDKTW